MFSLYFILISVIKLSIGKIVIKVKGRPIPPLTSSKGGGGGQRYFKGGGGGGGGRGL